MSWARYDELPMNRHTERSPTMSDGHTIDIGYVHTLNDDGTCRHDCPHPDHNDHLADPVASLLDDRTD